MFGCHFICSAYDNDNLQKKRRIFYLCFMWSYIIQMWHNYSDALVPCSNCHDLAFVRRHLRSVALWLYLFHVPPVVVQFAVVFSDWFLSMASELASCSFHRYLMQKMNKRNISLIYFIGCIHKVCAKDVQIWSLQSVNFGWNSFHLISIKN